MTGPKLLTTQDVAKLAHVKTSSIRQYRQRGVIPEPSGYLGHTPYWHASVITEWLRVRRGVGRPCK